MNASDVGGTRKWWESPIQTAYNIYLFAVGLVVVAFSLGIQIVLLDREIGRGDPFHFVHGQLLAVVLNVVTLVLFGLVIRKSVRRLLRTAQPD